MEDDAAYEALSRAIDDPDIDVTVDATCSRCDFEAVEDVEGLGDLPDVTQRVEDRLREHHDEKHGEGE